MLRDRIVCGVNSEKVKERLLRDNKLTLESALSVCRASEESVIHLKDLHSVEATAATVFKKPKDKHSALETGGTKRNKDSLQQPMYLKAYPHQGTKSHVEGVVRHMRKRNVQHSEKLSQV